jgi:DNA invertase Pin-like site-specific DNA recombinase
LNRLLADAQASRISVVMVWKLDRLGRSLQHLLTILDQLAQWRVDFVSLRDAGLDTTTPAGRLFTSIIGAFAEFERELIQERIRAGVQRAQAKGKHCGRPRLDLSADQLAAAQNLQAQGWGTRRIATTLGLKRSTLQRYLEAAQNPDPEETP